MSLYIYINKQTLVDRCPGIGPVSKQWQLLAGYVLLLHTEEYLYQHTSTPQISTCCTYRLVTDHLHSTDRKKKIKFMPNFFFIRL